MRLKGRRLFDEVAYDLPANKVKKSNKAVDVKVPIADRVDWSPMAVMQAKQMFSIKFFSRRVGAYPEYAIARNPDTLDESWSMLKNMPQRAKMEFGKDPQKNKLVCRMLVEDVDTGYYVYRKEEKKEDKT